MKKDNKKTLIIGLLIFFGLSLLAVPTFAQTAVGSRDLNPPAHLTADGPAFAHQGKNIKNETETVPLKPLYEVFTSSTCHPCVEANEILMEVLEANQGEYSLIKYQMDWPGVGDPYATLEGAVREDYYGVSSLPDLFIIGEELYPASSISQEIFDQYDGMVSSMEIEITEAFIDDENVISIDAEITPLANYEAGLIAHIVVVEKKTFNNVENNGEYEFHHVMMKMFPDALGTELGALNVGDMVTLSETYDMDETFMETPDDLAIVVFVQNNTDKSIVQSAMIDVDGVFYTHNVNYIVENMNGNPIEGAEVLMENYGPIQTDEYGQVIFENVLAGTYNYSVIYAGLISYSNTITLIDEDVTQEIVLEHYTSLTEAFSGGIPSSWTKHVDENNFLYGYSGKVKFFKSSIGGNNPVIMLISPAVEVHPSDTLSFDYGEIFDNPMLSFGIISNPYDPATYTELEILYPGNEWETYEMEMSSLLTSDTVMYFAWNISSITESSSFHLDNVFLKKEGVICMPIYTQGCDDSGMGFTDFILQQIDNSNSGCDELSGIGWSQYLQLGPAQLFAGETDTLSIATGSENIHASVWIDFNNDFVFTANEKVIDNFLMEDPGILYDVDISIPADTPDGQYLLRARTNGNGLCDDPCEEYYYGEAEDYLIQVGEELILPPANLNFNMSGSNIVLEWDAPNLKELTGYNIYHSLEQGSFEIIANVSETTFTHESPEYGPHQYYVTAVYNFGESDPTNTVEVLITGLLSHLDKGFKIYPNPVNGNKLNILIDDPSQVLSFMIINGLGQIVKTEQLTTRNSKVDISNLNSGIYIVKIAYMNYSYQIEKLVVK